MPAITFEKISPPLRRGPPSPSVQQPSAQQEYIKKSRAEKLSGLMAHIFDRILGSRARRNLRLDGTGG